MDTLSNETSEYEDHAESLKQDIKRFLQADEDKDNHLTDVEFAAFLHPEDHEHMVGHMVNSAIGDMDKNRDG